MDGLKCLQNEKYDIALVKLLKVERKSKTLLYIIGFIYYRYKKDSKKAVQYYLKAAEKGEIESMFSLGYLYFNELGDNKKAKTFYLKAIEKGNTKAMVNLAIMYSDTYKNYKQAEKYYLMAVEKGDTRAMVNLGILYSHEYKDYKKSEKYYLMALEKGDSYAKNSLAWLYFELKKNKNDSLKYAWQTFENESDIFNSHTYSCILLWHNEIEKAIEVSNVFMNNGDSYLKFPEDIKLFLLLLVAKKQYHYVFNLFNENKFNIKDRFKPIYYALMSLMQNEFPDEIKRMGSELEETVDEVLQKIEQLSIDYA
jgi:TPR repeat protein